jgi:4-amino-4-deoxy-L-arabinose transferase-like glycosyltransferase
MKRDLWVLLAVFVVLFGVELGTAELSSADEGRYAEIPREMVASGEWVTPRLDGVVYFEKPPLVYWCVAICLKVFGSSEWSMRLTPALFALSGVLLTYLVGRHLYGRLAGFAAATVLGKSLLYYALGRVLALDMAVSVLMSATLFCFILGVREAPGSRRRWLFYGLYASAALATLTKGLIGFLLTGAVMFLWLLIFNQWRRLRPFYLPTGALIFLAIAAPWHLLAAQRNPQWAHFYFIHEHWERFTTTEHGRFEPWWFFIPMVVVGLFPWTGFLWSALRDRLRGGWAARKENADTWFFVTWAVFVFLFFSKSQSKLIPYILPVFPPLAVVLGGWFSEVITRRESQRLRVGLRVFGFAAGLLSVAVILAVLKPGLIKDVVQRDALRDNAFWAAASLMTGGVLAAWLARVRGAIAALLAMAMATSGLFLSLARAQDEIARPGTKPLALVVKSRFQPGDRIYHYHEFFHDFLFYSEHLVGTVAYGSELELAIDPEARTGGRFIDEPEFRKQWEGPTRIWAVARKKDLAPLFGDASFRYHLIAESANHTLFSNQP